MQENHCKNCNKLISYQTTSRLCRSCSQKAATAKREATCLARYGVTNPMYYDKFVKKIADTMLERYGVNCAMKVPKFRSKYESTMKELYGVPYYVMTEEYLKNSHFRTSKYELEIQQKLADQGVLSSTEFVIEDKKYDIKLEDQNILLEVNPSYTHNVIGNHWTHTGLYEDYHANKTAIAAKYGYRCIHIWDWDDIDKLIQLVLPKTKIYARKCKIVSIDKQTADEFLNKYHIQGRTRSAVECYGLYYNDALVEVMTFGKPRYNKNYEYELLRLASHSNYQVIGGASKLFKHAVSQLHPRSIISYCDLSKFTGDVYEKLGMNLIRINQPQEIWSKGTAKILGSTLRAIGYDKLFDTDYGKGSSNEELMIRSGWLPVYDCGQAVYVWGDILQDDEAHTETSMKEHYQSVANAISKSKERLCDFCGLPFVPASNRQRYCKRIHKRICPICNKEYIEDNVENLKRPPIACSCECRIQKAKATRLIKYRCETQGNLL